MNQKIAKNISKSLTQKHNQKLLGHAEKVVTEAIKTALKKVNLQIAEATWRCIWHRIVDCK